MFSICFSVLEKVLLILKSGYFVTNMEKLQVFLIFLKHPGQEKMDRFLTERDLKAAELILIFFSVLKVNRGGLCNLIDAKSSLPNLNTDFY